MEDEKVSPKFTTQLISDALPDDPKLDELKRWISKFERSGLMPCHEGGSFGNLSFRTKDNEFIITASGMKDPSSGDSFVTVSDVDLEKRTITARGRKLPSSESMLHYMIYRERKDINAIFHGHCEKILKYADKMGAPVTPKQEPYGTVELAESVLETAKDNDFLVMKGHGFVSLGNNMDKAGEQALKVLNSIDEKFGPSK